MTGRGFLKLTAALYPFGAGAMAVNLFFASLIGSWLGWSVLTPYSSVIGGLILGLPVTWAFGRHIRALIARAEA
ncbi:NnrT protein [Maritimibacter sp. DP1N21-5]|uniref:NnrT protein n=1 Tax=Maritimibacter sp. DP1N21-5 TaxID=2836867 RepID=UPI001C447753|nr:NnrT protein [Maritimibacter sp. DP1N21-5]MBV7410069.1 NnrT protein [Maritimibacter sp. DP1N21-5]